MSATARLPAAMRLVSLSCTTLVLALGYAHAQQASQTPAPNPYSMGTEGLNQGPRGLTSYMPVAITESFASLMARLSAEKPAVEQTHNALLSERYDLSDRSPKVSRWTGQNRFKRASASNCPLA